MPIEGSNSSMWLMAVSIHPGAPLGGSITQYFPGSFNGTHFMAVDGAARLSDFRKDNYAGQFFYGLPENEDQVFLAWASNWQYSQLVPTGNLEGWRSSMCLPRKVHLANVIRLRYDLVSYPYDLEPLYPREFAQASSFANKSLTIDYSSFESGALYFKINMSSIPSDGTAGRTLNFTFTASSTNESVSGDYFPSGNTAFWINRGKTYGFDNPFFTDKFSTNADIGKNGLFMLEGVVDRSILEVFINGGQSSATTTFSPVGKLETLVVATGDLNGVIMADIEVWVLRSAWADMASSKGIVYGHTTST
jgi:beta-fructofuranosidase